MHTRVGVSSCALAALAIVAGWAHAASAALPASGPTPPAIAALPTDFVENRGQWADSTRFIAWKGNIVASLERDAIRVRLGADPAGSVSLKFEDASPDARLQGESERSGYYNFFLGNDRERWRSRVPAYGSVLYRGIYEGVDLRVRDDGSRLEYDVLLQPGSDLAQVIVRTEGATKLALQSDGSLVVSNASGSMRQTPPRTWQRLPSGENELVESSFRIIDEQHYGFEVRDRDPGLALTLDPGLEWSTFLGGGEREEMQGLAATNDGTGDVIVAGKTWSPDFPATSGGLGASPLIPFVARLNSTGSVLVYATLFGSTNGNVAHLYDVAVDVSGAPIAVGETNGLDFPTTPGAYDPDFNAPGQPINRGWDAFVTRFDATGSQMVFSTFLGAAPIFDPTRPGSSRGGDEGARAVAVDASGAVIVAGYTTSENFPTTAGAYDRTLDTLVVPVGPGTVESRIDIFVSRFDPAGTQLTYSTYLGAQSDDLVHDLVVSPLGPVTLVGTENPIETIDPFGNRTDYGTPFPTTPDAIDRTHLGASDVILARMTLDGAGAADLRYSTIFGGFYIDDASSVAQDPNDPDSITIAGTSRSWDFPTTPGTWSRAPLFLPDGDPDYAGFVARFRLPGTSGGSLAWSTLVEGTTGGQLVNSVAVDAGGDLIVTGSDSGGLPTTERSFKRLPASGVFVSRFSGDGRQLLYSTFLERTSGLFSDVPRVVSVGPHAVIVAGQTLKPTFPVTPGAFDTLFGADGQSDGFDSFDVFVSRLTLDPNTSADTSAAAPALVSPANGASLPLGSNLTLDWTDVADASGVQYYEVAVSMNAAFLGGFGSAFPPGAGFYSTSQVTTPTSQEGVFYWRVRTLDNVNNFSPWSEVRSFRLGPSNWTNFAAAALTPNGVVGGGAVQGQIHIQNFAPAGGQVYTLTSSNPSVATVPATVTIPAGAASATFTVTTRPVTTSTPVQISLTSEGNGDRPVLIFSSPAANAPDSGGDGNGFETGAANAHADGAGNAIDRNSGTSASTSCTSSARDKHRYFNYGLSVQDGATVQGLEVRLDARADSATGAPRMCVQLSWNGGASWTAPKATPRLGTSLATYVLGSPTDTWGRTWSAAQLSDTNFRVRVITTANTTTRDFALDWVPVRVTTTSGAAGDTTPAD
jgi:hypothetical protein